MDDRRDLGVEWDEEEESGLLTLERGDPYSSSELSEVDSELERDLLDLKPNLCFVGDDGNWT